MKKFEIERAAWDVLAGMYRRRDRLWPLGSPKPIDMLQPVKAAKYLGVKYRECEFLGPFGIRGESKVEIAGSLDRVANEIVICSKPPFLTRNFTAAHEIGHYVLHDGEIQHRDRPISGLGQLAVPRKPIEREADYFAACFLVPTKLLRAAFEELFLCSGPFTFDDASAFALNPVDPDALLRPTTGLRERALALATTEHYGRAFPALHKQFRVSAATMAIRLEEVGLVQAD